MGFYSLEFSRNQTTFKDYQTATATQLIADGQDPSHEFRESFKPNQSAQGRLLSHNFFYEASQNTFQIIRYARYKSYQKKNFNQRPPEELFIDFRSLII